MLYRTEIEKIASCLGKVELITQSNFDSGVNNNDEYVVSHYKNRDSKHRFKTIPQTELRTELVKWGVKFRPHLKRELNLMKLD